MKAIEELKDGFCVVVAESGADRKEFTGIYNSSLNIVFMTMPQRYEIVGYKQ